MNNRSTLFLLLLSLCFAGTIPVTAQNKAVSLDATSNQWVSIPAPVIPFTGQATVELWVYVPSATAMDGLDHSFIYQGQQGAALFIGYEGINGMITAGDEYDGGAPTSTPMVYDQWVHFTLTVDWNTSEMFLYMNGTPIGHQPPFPFGNYTAGGNQNTQIGLHSSYGINYLNGKVTQVKVWQSIRTQAQFMKDMFSAPDLSDPDLLAYYDFNETTGATVTNYGTFSSSANGTLQGGATRVASPIIGNNNAISLDGIASRVEIAPSNTFDLAGGGTIEAWVKPAVIDATERTIIGNRGASGINYSFHLLKVGGNNVVRMYNNSTHADIIVTTPVGDWTHLAFVNGGGNSTDVFENGASVGTIPLGFSGISTQGLMVGMANNGAAAADRPFQGGIDEVRVWNVTRNATEITANKDQSLTGAETGLQALYTFDQGINGGDNTGLITIPDYTGNSNNGTLVNFNMTGTTSNMLTHNFGILPVTYTRFDAVKQGATALLQWQTAQEQNSQDFGIERSTDGKNYISIGSVEAAGNSTDLRNYAFVDASPATGANYYRLQQRDLDGHFRYSAIKVLNFSNTGKLVWYSTGSRSVEVSLQQGSSEQYAISDISGRIVRQGRLSNGKTTLSGVSAGIYVVKVTTTAGQIMDAKIMVP